ncbi:MULTISPECIES: NDMA-dependent alcohol dehydrogenase [unclassified Pseudofrankia]|uniref:NDMA-dependent alcohol dehydrogenase n=1 Tax=unclassified Pseudofrankia TaxID=2994372 RepID=UPI0008D9F388|nr:NDMA-dependent alcohol dehydrogenase [Pseudofrankia sp. BMG5.36]MDT3444949.1 NDMA-dependent alcohol dehydrogenase [Pseudofrankia sp. BMG5.37]OHV47333.1 alcohol dehydrogenase [Pseudofrankia sp. BMG5.36]
MLTRGAILRQAPGEFEVADLELDDPRRDEVQVTLVASGMCHSDDHIATGDLPVGTYPFATGHEGAGIVTKAFANDRGINEGDHVVFSSMPSCGHCRYCASGMQTLCNLSAGMLAGVRSSDGSYRLHLTDGTPVGQMCGISTFTATTTAPVTSVIKIDKDIPLDKACLAGCAVGTGWGSAVNSANVQPGDIVVVMGIGGIGANALQGAVHAGASQIIAVDPLAFKREKAMVLGATHAVASMEEASEIARQFTNGQGADSVVITVGVLKPEHVGQGVAAIRKAGTCVLTAVAPTVDVGAQIPLFDFVLSGKRLVGSLFGETNPTRDIPRQLRLYQEGKLNLDAMVTNTYTLDQVAQGYRDMHAGRNIRGVIRFD